MTKLEIDLNNPEYLEPRKGERLQLCENIQLATGQQEGGPESVRLTLGSTVYPALSIIFTPEQSRFFGQKLIELALEAENIQKVRDLRAKELS